MMHIEVVTVHKDHSVSWVCHEINVPQSVADLVESGILQDGAIGVYGQLVERSYQVQDGDRFECYQPLDKDPKSARRARLG